MNNTNWTGTCAELKQVDPYLDRELQGACREAFESHLRECGACTAELTATTNLRASLRSAVSKEQAPDELRLAIRQHIRGRGEPRAFFSPRGRWLGAWASAAAAVVLAVVLWPSGSEGIPNVEGREQQNSFIQRVSLKLANVFRPGFQDHVHCAVFRGAPKTATADEVMAKELGEKYALLAPLVRERLTSHDKLMQAHQCSWKGRHFVHLVMRRGSALISLVITAKEGQESFADLRPVASETTRLYGTAAAGQQITGFETRDYLVYLVSDLSREQNLQLAKRFAPFVTEFLNKV